MTTREVFDVAVIGGGSAGVAAALGASAQGARTLLVERCDALGGNVSQAHVHTICGLYDAVDPKDDAAKARFSNVGFAPALALELQRVGAAREPERAGRVFVLPLSPPHYATQLAVRVAAAAPTLECAMQTHLRSAELASARNEPNQLRLERAGEARDIEAGFVIDTSGDGVLSSCANADAEREVPERLQRASFIFRLGRVQSGALAGFARMQLSATVAGAERRGDLPAGCESVLVRAGADGEAYVTVNMPPLEGRVYCPQEEACRLELEERGRHYAQAITKLLRERYAAFRDAEISAFPQRLGVREGARLKGRMTIDETDILSGRRREDEVARSSWPIELWHDHRRAELRYAKGAASVPLGALVSASHPKLAMAGRCLSATHAALGALRVVGTALATGEAAGRAAAIAADSGRDLWQVEGREVLRSIRGDAP